MRHFTALVPQEPVLFSGSIAENILMGKHDTSHEEIVAAAREAGADSFITAMRGGYETQDRRPGNNGRITGR
ncbi:hypothetical protein FACS1894151_05710 [Spirochaetia bacterium]|nr:hypothetical protein FACS1894151_05710 [Spirochaetia bacterium]